MVGPDSDATTGSGALRRGRGGRARPPIFLAAALLAFAVSSSAQAVLDPREMLPDPAQEARAREIGRGLRCLVCQNQSIDDSNAELARDLRRIVRERIAAGDTDEEVVRFVVDRYGEFVLLKPPLNAMTIALWASPAVLFGLGALSAWLYLRRRRPAPGAPAELSAEERARLKGLLTE
ncbi:MAG: cytochrome c-type biogenesis protein [Acetobacteraceae bacterium]|nr:cytochrome c-type biogenesis protein [Acetobacteraceae bacterium]